MTSGLHEIPDEHTLLREVLDAATQGRPLSDELLSNIEFRLQQGDQFAELRDVIYDRKDRGRQALRARVEAAENALTDLGWELQATIHPWPPTYTWTPPDGRS
jgi:hypothetical protein